MKNGLLARIAFILLNLRKHPVEFAGSDFSAAKFADSHGVYFQCRATIRTIQVGASGHRLCFTVADESPVLAPLAQIGFGSRDDLAVLIDGVIEALGEDSQ